MLITRLFGWGGGIIISPNPRMTFILHYISSPTSRHSFNTSPQPPKYIRYFIPPRPLHHHAITFSYTISTISITNSYIMVVCEVVRSVIAQPIHSYIEYNALVLLHVYCIHLPPDRVSIVFY